MTRTNYYSTITRAPVCFAAEHTEDDLPEFRMITSFEIPCCPCLLSDSPILIASKPNGIANDQFSR